MTLAMSSDGYLYCWKAGSLDEYVKLIKSKIILAENDRLYYRGLSRKSYNLSPSIDRMMNNKDKWLCKESRLIEFAEQTYRDIFDKEYPTLILSNMQHYGIPTRMMDITGNAFVALFFACDYEDNDEDGKVVVFCGTPVTAYNPYSNIIADSYRLINNAYTNLDTYLSLINEQSYATRILYPNCEKKENFKSDTIRILSKPLIVDVGIINQRQRNQDGKFILFPNRIENEHILNELVSIDNSSDMVKAEIIIPKEIKKELREQLRMVGITESFIYPDDINKVLGDLKMDLMGEDIK